MRQSSKDTVPSRSRKNRPESDVAGISSSVYRGLARSGGRPLPSKCIVEKVHGVARPSHPFAADSAHQLQLRSCCLTRQQRLRRTYQERARTLSGPMLVPAPDPGSPTPRSLSPARQGYGIGRSGASRQSRSFEAPGWKTPEQRAHARCSGCSSRAMASPARALSGPGPRSA